MIRKTFATKPEAIKYQNEMADNGHTTVLGALGDRFRVYVETKEESENMKSWRRDNWDKGATERYLRKIAWEEGESVGDAFALKKMLESDEIYNNFESAIEAARIMENQRELKTAGDVFNFIDDTHHYDKAMKQIIDVTLADYDYEGKEESKKE